MRTMQYSWRKKKAPGWPRIVEILKEKPWENPFGSPDRNFQKAVKSDLPKTIASLEAHYPKNHFIFLGDDLYLLANLFQAYYDKHPSPFKRRVLWISDARIPAIINKPKLAIKLLQKKDSSLAGTFKSWVSTNQKKKFDKTTDRVFIASGHIRIPNKAFLALQAHYQTEQKLDKDLPKRVGAVGLRTQSPLIPRSQFETKPSSFFARVSESRRLAQVPDRFLHLRTPQILLVAKNAVIRKGEGTLQGWGSGLLSYESILEGKESLSTGKLFMSRKKFAATLFAAVKDVRSSEFGSSVIAAASMSFQNKN